MLEKLTEKLLPPIIKAMVHNKEQLSEKAQQAQDNYLDSLTIKTIRTKRQLAIALVGLVGSGKSSVANELSSLIGATIIEGDAVRVALRKAGEAYKYVRQIGEYAILEVLRQGGNVIIDADHIDSRKRASLREKLKATGTQLLFIRTHADLDVMIGRAMTAPYEKSVDDFFGGAKTPWTEGTPQQTGATIKLKEMMRRTPHHYSWKDEGGGAWQLKKLPFKLFADLDTTNPEQWKAELKKAIEPLL